MTTPPNETRMSGSALSSGYSAQELNYVALDIGGTLAKIAYYAPTSSQNLTDNSRQSSVPSLSVRADGEGKIAHAGSAFSPELKAEAPTETPAPMDLAGSRPTSEKGSFRSHNYLNNNSARAARQRKLSYQKSYAHERIPGRIYFHKFESKDMGSVIEYIQTRLLPSNPNITEIRATGGGAHKYVDVLEQNLKMPVKKLDEMKCAATGCTFLLQEIPDEAFTFNKNRSPACVYQTAGGDVFPYLLVNIGSGVSMLKVTGPDTYERVGGTSMGGGTFWGLSRLLTDAKDFDELLDMCRTGNHRNVDMLVGDIYGGDYGKIGLKAENIASSFGKMSKVDAQGGGSANLRDKVSQEDIAKSLLHMISNNIGQIAYLQSRLHGLNRIYFGGYFIRNHVHTMHTISYAINFWSQGQMQALFLRHEGWLGVIGAFVSGALRETTGRDSATEEKKQQKLQILSHLQPRLSKISWRENRAWTDKTNGNGGMTEELVFDSMPDELAPLPHIENLEAYNPDTINLIADDEGRKYWIEYCYTSIGAFVQRAVDCEGDTAEATIRGNDAYDRFMKLIKSVEENPAAHGELSLRTLLDTREEILHDHGFKDPYWQKKQVENDAALAMFPQVMIELDEMSEPQRYREVLRNVLGGNVFDWGAKDVSDMLEAGKLDFQTAKQKIREPWFVDDSDLIIRRMVSAGIRKVPPWRKILIFPDNSGADIVLGIFPFVRELLRMGSTVILAVNSEPALNDVTYPELLQLSTALAGISPLIKKSLMNNNLRLMSSGSTSLCLDLRKIDSDICAEAEDCDLMVLEGMGRSVITNWDASFTIDTLKIASLKSKWMAEQMGAQVFDACVRFEPAGGENVDGRSPRPSLTREGSSPTSSGPPSARNSASNASKASKLTEKA
eukprot:Clim_evm19s227 gene=Clim_evmTU19s227